MKDYTISLAESIIPSLQYASESLLKRSGDSLWATKYDTGTCAFIITSSAMLVIMITGLALLYFGLARRKNCLALLFIVISASFLVTFQWYFWGYSLAFSSTATNGYIGNLDSFGFKNLLTNDPSLKYEEYPELLFAIFQGFFACVANCITVGAIAERGRILPCMIFCFIWTTIVYCPIACWVWNSNGWAYKYDVLDYAGGGPVEIASGFSGFAYAIVLGSRNFDEPMESYRPHNSSFVGISGMFLWVSWCFFNAGTALTPNMRAIIALMNTNISGCVGAITWCLLDYRIEKKYSLIGATSGLICGLVAATPSSAFIPIWASVIQGIVASAACNFATGFKYLVGVDDSLDILAEHGLAGIVGLIFNAIFSANYIVGLDGITEHKGGWITHNYKQLYIQVAYIVAVSAYSFVLSMLICLVLNYIPGLQLRASAEAESHGMDEDQLGEFAYDYVEVRREFHQWAEPSSTPFPQSVPLPAKNEEAAPCPKEALTNEKEMGPDNTSSPAQ